MVTADLEEVPIGSKQEWFNRHTKTRPILVEEQNNKIIAWVSFTDFYSRPAYHQTAEISIYIHPDHRAKGLGSKLLVESIALAPSLNLKNLIGYVFTHNTPSIKLLEKHNFKKWGNLPNIAQMDSKDYSVTILGLKL